MPLIRVEINVSGKTLIDKLEFLKKWNFHLGAHAAVEHGDRGGHPQGVPGQVRGRGLERAGVGEGEHQVRVATKCSRILVYFLAKYL